MKITKKTDIHVKLNLGKIAYRNPKIKANNAVVNVGFTYLNGNNESYFSVTGDIWNNINTDIVCGGCGTPQMLLEEFFKNNALLKHICELADKWHLTSFSWIPEDVKKEIISVMEEIEEKSK